MGRHHRAALVAKQELQHFSSICARCGQRLGKHRYGDDQCPNLRWKPGMGEQQWGTTSFIERVEVGTSWPPAGEAPRG